MNENNEKLKTRLFLLSITLCMFAVISCDKDVDTSEMNPHTSIKGLEIPYYNNIEDVMSRIEKIQKLDGLDAVYQYESSLGYLSVGLIADMVCDTLDFERYVQLPDGIVQLSAIYKNYVDTIHIENDIYVDAKFDNNVFRHVANADGLFRVGDTIVRIFKNATLATHIQNVSLLLSIEESNMDDIECRSIFDFIENMDITTIKSLQTDHTECAGFSWSSMLGQYNMVTPNNSNGDRRVKLETTWVQTVAFSGNPTCSRFFHWLTLTAYKKVAGVWVPTKSNISYRTDILYHWYTPDYYWECYVRYNDWITTYTRKIELIMFEEDCCNILGVNGVHYEHLTISTYAPYSGVLTISD